MFNRNYNLPIVNVGVHKQNVLNLITVCVFATRDNVHLNVNVLFGIVRTVIIKRKQERNN